MIRPAGIVALLAATVLTATAATGSHALEYDIAAYGINAPTGIIGSDDRRPVSAGSWPFVVKIYDKKEKFLCNGSVVGSRMILTSAHCGRLPRGKWRSPSRLPHWVVTWKNSVYAVDKINIAPDYGSFPARNGRSISDDVAFITTTVDLLDETGSVDIMESRRLRDGSTVSLVGYSPKNIAQLLIQTCKAGVYSLSDPLIYFARNRC